MRCDSHIPLREKAPLANRFPAIAGLARELNWHIEFVAPLKMINENAELLKTSRVPVMIDHYGFYTGVIPEESEGAALLKLLAMPHMWIKLSAPYRTSSNPLATKPDPAWHAAILAVAPDRCVWGSDWPHTPPHEKQIGSTAIAPYRSLRYETLVDDFIAATGSAELTERILSDNPARLYEFE